MLQARPTSYLKLQLGLSLALVALISLGLLAYFWLPTSQKNPTNLTVFSQPRAIQPFLLGNVHEKNQKLLFSQDNFKQHWTFLFFGFTHCSEVCPATLTELNEVYQNLHTRFPGLQVVFISIDPEHETKTALQHYVSAFNKNFIGLSGTTEQVKKLKEQFGVLAERDESAGTSTLNHTSSIFLINPEGQWTALFPYGMRSKQIETNFKMAIENNSHV